MSKMSDVPKEVARLIVQATAPTHGPIVRFTCDIVTSNVNEDTGEVDLYARCDVSRLHEFADNSGAAPSGAFPHARLASMLLGGEDEQASVYFSGHGGLVATVFSKLAKCWNVLQSNGQLVIVRSMQLVSAGTWQPTAAERAHFEA